MLVCIGQIKINMASSISYTTCKYKYTIHPMTVREVYPCSVVCKSQIPLSYPASELVCDLLASC